MRRYAWLVQQAYQQAYFYNGYTSKKSGYVPLKWERDSPTPVLNNNFGLFLLLTYQIIPTK